MTVKNDWKRLLPRKEFLALAVLLAILYLVSYVTVRVGDDPPRAAALDTGNDTVHEPDLPGQ